MGNQLLASKVITEEEAPSLRGVPALDTAVACFIGITEKGPVNVATLTNSMSEFNTMFGGWTADSAEMVAAVQGFFENGGSQLYIIRVTSAAADEDLGTVTLVNGSSANTLDVNGKYLGTYAHGYKVKITAPSSGDTTGEEFNFEVRDASNLIVEIFPDLTMDVTALRYAPSVINDPVNGSTRIAVEDLELSGSASVRRPAYATSAFLAGGSDVLSGIADSDYIGTEVDATGLYALDVIDDVTILAVPGLATSGVHNAMISYAEVKRNGQIFCIFDPPANNTATQIITYVAGLGVQSEFAGIYWPQVKIVNPSKTVFGNVTEITVPPSGHIAGVMARNDNAREGGVWTPPAGTENGRLFGVIGFETDDVLKEAVRDRIFPKRINPLTTMKGFPRFIDGARNLKGDGNWPTIGQRRGVSYVERSLKLGSQWARNQNNTSELRQQLYSTYWTFLKTQCDLGAFASKIPDEAFFVDFGNALNPVTRPNLVMGRVGMATNQPSEFIKVLFSQDTRAIEAARKAS